MPATNNCNWSMSWKHLTLKITGGGSKRDSSCNWLNIDINPHSQLPRQSTQEPEVNKKRSPATRWWTSVKPLTCNGLLSRWCYPCFEFSSSNGKATCPSYFLIGFLLVLLPSLSASRGERAVPEGSEMATSPTQHGFSVLSLLQPLNHRVSPFQSTLSPFQSLFKSIPNPCLIL